MSSPVQSDAPWRLPEVGLCYGGNSEGQVKKVRFQSGVKEWGSDGRWEVRTNKLTSTRRRESAQTGDADEVMRLTNCKHLLRS